MTRGLNRSAASLIHVPVFPSACADDGGVLASPKLSTTASLRKISSFRRTSDGSKAPSNIPSTATCCSHRAVTSYRMLEGNIAKVAQIRRSRRRGWW